MRKYFRPFCATFLAVCVFYITSVSVFADDNGTSSGTEYVQKSSFFHMFAGTVFSRKVIGYAFDGMVCPNTEDGYHRATSYEEYKKPLIGDPYYSCICEHCGHTFKAYESDLKQSYEAQVSEMEDTYHTTIIDINGLSNIKLTGWTRNDSPSGVTVVNFNPDIIDLYWTVTSNKNNSYSRLLTSRDFSFPIDGTYTVLFPSFSKFPSSIRYQLYSFTLQYSFDNGQTSM